MTTTHNVLRAHETHVHEIALAAMLDAHHRVIPATRNNELAGRLFYTCDDCQEVLREKFPDQDPQCVVISALIWIGSQRAIESDTTMRMIAEHCQMCPTCNAELAVHLSGAELSEATR